MSLLNSSERGHIESTTFFKQAENYSVFKAEQSFQAFSILCCQLAWASLSQPEPAWASLSQPEPAWASLIQEADKESFDRYRKKEPKALLYKEILRREFI